MSDDLKMFVGRWHGKTHANQITKIKEQEIEIESLRAENERHQETEAWNRVAAESNRALTAYLVENGIPEHHGMPVDGVRKLVENLRARVNELERALQALYSERATDCWCDDTGHKELSGNCSACISRKALAGEGSGTTNKKGETK